MFIRIEYFSNKKEIENLIKALQRTVKALLLSLNLLSKITRIIKKKSFFLKKETIIKKGNQKFILQIISLKIGEKLISLLLKLMEKINKCFSKIK